MSKSVAKKTATPEGYVILNDGIFGEWSVFLDDEFWTVLGDNFATKANAVSFALDHKKENA